MEIITWTSVLFITIILYNYFIIQTTSVSVEFLKKRREGCQPLGCKKSVSHSSTLVWPLESFFFVLRIGSMPRSAVCALRAGTANGPEIGTGGAGHLGYLQETCAEPHTHQQVWICTIITNRRSLPPPLPFSCCFPLARSWLRVQPLTFTSYKKKKLTQLRCEKFSHLFIHYEIKTCDDTLRAIRYTSSFCSWVLIESSSKSFPALASICLLHIHASANLTHNSFFSAANSCNYAALTLKQKRSASRIKEK